ncbi:hypothetical protein [Erwinia sp. ErVv1]|uniref:hypothetical protein n=1 Tax=Erwinia sp. ErVv1 TaxID=1603299 RepID=UPI0008312239|nr:hypothetical protein [Erwinia sp. ErVv1]
MFRIFAAGCLLVSATFAARATPDAQPMNAEFQITCPGRQTMTVTEAQYGLTTLMWPGNHFQIAAGQQQSSTDSGTRVSIVLFRNGDQMIVNKADQETFFSFEGAKKLVPCSRSSERENSAVTLQRTDATGNVES